MNRNGMNYDAMLQTLRIELPDLIGFYVFGSRATGPARPDSPARGPLLADILREGRVLNHRVTDDTTPR